MIGRTRDERGSALILAVIAMLILSILGVSFALLSRIETTIGHNYRQQAQAEAMAEAGLDRARDTMRTAVTTNDGFTSWLGDLWSGANQTPTAYSGNSAYWYRARVDNDCTPFVPTSIAEVQPLGETCGNTVDRNETVVVTAWSEAGSGRSRIRAILAVDNAWKHVCSAHEADNGGLCNNDDNTNGNPSIQPADPNDPNGPAAWDDLPRPYLGCSRIDPTLHGAAELDCQTYPEMYQYPYPTGVGTPRWVVMGPDPAVVTGAETCNPTGLKEYFGYFDCALATPCDTAVTNCGGNPGTPRLGCLDPNHPNGYDTSKFVRLDPPPFVSPNTCADKLATGMVFATGDLPNEDWGGSFGGNPLTRFTYYVMRGHKVSIQDHSVFGTVVVEGTGTPTSGTNFCTGGDRDAEAKTRSKFYTGPTPATNPPAGTWGTEQYGFPLAFLVFDPVEAKESPSLPTPAGDPQRTCADMGSAGGGPSDRAQIHGMVYSGGHVEFNPISMDGSVIAWEIQTQATSSNYSYNYSYGDAAPPAGFPKSGGTEVRVVRKSFIVCSSFAAPTSACN
jgi:Tfp pilus assembly protein PilX